MAIPMPPHSWHTKPTNAYDKTSTEAIENAMCIYDLYHSYGWTLNAIAGVLGNIGWESGYNPWRWNMTIPASTDPIWTSTGAYGLVQFHPPSKYISDSRAQAMQGYGPNFSDVSGNIYDGQAQMEFVNYYADYIPTPSHYPISYSDFKITNDTPENCALIWMYNYERFGTPTQQDIDRRCGDARYWYDLLAQYDPDVPPTPPTPPTPIPRRKMPVWMMALKRLH